MRFLLFIIHVFLLSDVFPLQIRGLSIFPNKRALNDVFKRMPFLVGLSSEHKFG